MWPNSHTFFWQAATQQRLTFRQAARIRWTLCPTNTFSFRKVAMDTRAITFLVRKVHRWASEKEMWFLIAVVRKNYCSFSLLLACTQNEQNLKFFTSSIRATRLSPHVRIHVIPILVRSRPFGRTFLVSCGGKFFSCVWCIECMRCCALKRKAETTSTSRRALLSKAVFSENFDTTR